MPSKLQNKRLAGIKRDGERPLQGVLLFAFVDLMMNGSRNMDKKNSFGTKVGRFLGNVFVACIAACLSAIAIAITVRFIVWMF